MQSNIVFPLTLALSLREREPLSTGWGDPAHAEVFPVRAIISLSPRERVGVRGRETSDFAVTAY
jgi:hypothetical protein